MPRALLLLLLAGPLAAAPDPAPAPASVFVIADTANDTLTIADNVAHTVLATRGLTVADLLDANDTLADPDADHDPVVRKKRTFGEIVFRGLADVLGYQVQRRPPQQAFPPPLAPVPGIDAPLQAVPAPAPAPAVAPPPCGAPRAVGPPPCRAQLPPPPPPPPKPAPPPCAGPRAVPRPKPRPPPPPPPPPPCGRANPATPAPCAPPPPKVQADSNLETLSSNFRLDFNFNRAPATPATQAADEALVQAQAEEQALQLEQFAPIAIQPRAARLPPAEPRKPRVFVDAFVVRNGIARRADTVDARHLDGNGQQAALDNDYLAYDDDVQEQDARVQSQDDREDYHDDVQEYRERDRSKAVRDFGTAVDQFWEQKQKKTKKKKKKTTPARAAHDLDYRDVHFGDRDLAEEIRQRNGNEESHQSLQRKGPNTNRILPPTPEEEDAELTTTTQDPRRRLKPRVLPPTEQNPSQIDTVTVRVPPIYKERHPKKLHRDGDGYDAEEEHEIHSGEVRYEETEPAHHEETYDGQDSDTQAYTHAHAHAEPWPRRRGRLNRRARSAPDADPFSAGDYDYYGKQLPVSDEEKLYRGLTIPPPTADADLARLERGPGDDGHFLDESERLRDDRERPADERADDDDSDGDDGEDEGSERSDKLSPNAKVQETGYKKNYRRASNVKVDDGEVQPSAAPPIRKRIRKVIKT